MCLVPFCRMSSSGFAGGLGLYFCPSTLRHNKLAHWWQVRNLALCCHIHAGGHRCENEGMGGRWNGRSSRTAVGQIITWEQHRIHQALGTFFKSLLLFVCFLSGKLSVLGQRTNSFGFAVHTTSAVTAHFCRGGTKASMGDPDPNTCGCVPVKLVDDQ